ncbi:MAG TPA: hypothetical protein VFE53_02095 [Mucilaginibacter sp.]|jgi:hypothetical protein|nr:hypothetical protein [Mucilaginibacter sp.]
MKKTFTKLFSTGLLMGLTLIGFAVNAQTTSLTNTGGSQGAPATVTNAPFEQRPDAVKPDGKTNGDKTTTTTKAAAEDTAWHPQRRLWGYTFGDFYYDAHSPATTVAQGKENNYYQVPTYRNAFQFRRLYLGYDYEISKKFKAEVLLATEPTANTNAVSTTVPVAVQNGDNLVDSHMAFWIKNFNIRVRDLWNGTDFVIGELSTPGFALNEPGTNAPTSLSETTWGYRSVERTITDFHKNNSYDVGAALQGTFDPTTKNFGYVLMASNNSTSNLLNAGNANTGFYKIFYGDLWGKFADNHLYADFYFHTARTAPATSAIGGQSNTMYKLFIAYLSKPFNIGIEPYTQTFTNGVTNKTTNTVESPTVNAFSVWVRGALSPTWNYFAKYDTYNPYTDFSNMDAYSVNTNYGAYDPYTKEHFLTFGLDYNPTKNVHFMPNIWYIQYVDLNDPSVSGYVPNNHTLVYRMTFFFTFGK